MTLDKSGYAKSTVRRVAAGRARPARRSAHLGECLGARASFEIEPAAAASIALLLLSSHACRRAGGRPCSKFYETVAFLEAKVSYYKERRGDGEEGGATALH